MEESHFCLRYEKILFFYKIVTFRSSDPSKLEVNLPVDGRISKFEMKAYIVIPFIANGGTGLGEYR